MEDLEKDETEWLKRPFQDFKTKVYPDLKGLLDKLYEECEHGDEEHRKWLKDKFDDFYNRNK